MRRRLVNAFVVSCWLLSVPALMAEEEPGRHSHELEEITVTATPLKRSAAELAQPTSLLTGEELAKKQAGSLGQTLAGEAGLSSTYFGPIASRPVIRGQSGERVRILQDSLDSLDVSALSADHQVALEGILTERIEVVRGPATLLYGSGASGGLVNVIDDRIAEAAPERPVSGKVALSTDSAIDGRAAAARIDAGSDGIVVHLDFARRLSGNVEVPGFVESRLLREAEGESDEEAARGVVENTDGESSSGAVSVSWPGTFGFIGVSLGGMESNYGVPGEHAHEEAANRVRKLGAAAPESEAVRIGLRQTRIDLKARYEFGGLIEEARLRMGRNDYTHTEFEGTETGTVFDSKGMETRLELSHRPIAGFNGAVGIQRKSVNFDALGDEAFVPASATVQTSVFLFEELALSERALLQAGARLEHQSLSSRSAGGRYSRSGFSASVGAIHDLTPSAVLSANLSWSERHPNATELLADGPHVALSRYERGAFAQGLPSFEKEATTNLDVSLRAEGGRWQGSLTGFFSKVQDYIFAAPTGQVLDDLPVFNFRQSDAEFYGFEAEGRIELLEGPFGHLHAHLFGDFVYGEEDGDGPYLPLLPPLRYGLGLDFAGENLAASLRVTRHARQDKTAAGEFPSAAYTMVDAMLDYHFGASGVWLFAGISNLTDEDARQHSSPVKELVPLPGRSLRAGLRYEF